MWSNPRLLAVLRVPGVPLLAVGAALASLPVGFLGLAVLLVMRTRDGAFTTGGLVVAALGAGTVAGMLAQGRLIDRYGCRLVLVPAAAVRLLAGGSFVLGDHLPLVVSVGLVALMGAAEPQVSTALRAVLPRLVDVELRPAAAAVSALLFEIPVLAGPLLLAAVLAVTSPGAAVAAAVLCSALGAVVFTAGRRPRAATPGPAIPRRGDVARGGGPLRVPFVRRLVAVVAVQGLAVGVAQIAAAARAAEQGSAASAGLLYAALTAGSLAGTALAGARSRGVAGPWTVPLLLLGLAAVTAAAAAAPDPLLLAACLLAFGLCAGPLVLGCFVELERSAPADAPTTAVTLLVAAGLAATSAGAALAGLLVDAHGPAAPLALVAGLLLAASLASAVAPSRP